jgi:hypothetical protein
MGEEEEESKSQQYIVKARANFIKVSFLVECKIRMR